MRTQQHTILNYLQTSIGKWHYYTYGAGEKIILAFHGFGMHGRQFAPLEESLGKEYTIVSFDAFFHGHSELFDLSDENILKGMPLQALLELVDAVKHTFNVTELNLMGYSMGASFCLSIYQHQPKAIQNLILISPAGLYANALQTFGSNTLIGKKITHYLTYHPKPILLAIESARWLRLFDKQLHYTARYETRNIQTRLVAFRSLHFFKLLKPKIDLLYKQIKEHNTPMLIISGKKDKLIKAKNVEKFVKGLASCNLILLDDGHDIVNKKLNPILQQYAKS